MDFASVSDGVQTLDVLETGAKNVDRHSLHHIFGQVGDADVVCIEVRPVVPFAGQYFLAFVVEGSKDIFEA